MITGKLNKFKKIHLLLNSVHKLISMGYKVNCNIIGDGEEMKNLKKLSLELKIDKNVIFHGPIFGSNIHKFFMIIFFNISDYTRNII